LKHLYIIASEEEEGIRDPEEEKGVKFFVICPDNLLHGNFFWKNNRNKKAAGFTYG
jgi:hypothetical protein